MSENRPDPAVPETEAARVFLLNGRSFAVAIVKGSWAHWLMELKGSGGYFNQEVAIPITSIACVVRGATLESIESMERLHQQPVTPIYQGRPN